MNWKDVGRNVTGLINSDLNNAGNACRNPGNLGDKPWCFINHTQVTWDYCNITVCPKPGRKLLCSMFNKVIAIKTFTCCV